MNKPLTPLDLVAVGEDVAVVLPKDVAARLSATAGGHLFLTEDEDGSFHLGAAEEFAVRIAIARDIIRQDSDILRALAQ